MVYGLEKFKEYFEKFNYNYALIGGTACDILLSSKGIDFRATKDFDIVLLLEAVNEDFVKTIIKFVQDGEYSHINKGTGKEQFYRFEKPNKDNFPKMIELFSKKPEYIKSLDIALAPIHINDDLISLSAILLNDEYYTLLKNNIVEIDGVTIINIEELILYKMKAYLDLYQRKTHGENIDSNDIKKHKNDVFRLLANADPGIEVNVNDVIKKDIISFIGQVDSDKPDLKNLRLPNIYSDYIQLIKEIFHV